MTGPTGGVQLPHELGRPHRRVAGGCRAGPEVRANGPSSTRYRPRATKFGRPAPAKWAHHARDDPAWVARRTPVAICLSQRPVAESRVPRPMITGGDTRPASGACPGRSHGKQLGGRCRNQLQLGFRLQNTRPRIEPIAIPHSPSPVVRWLVLRYQSSYPEPLIRAEVLSRRLTRPVRCPVGTEIERLSSDVGA